MERRVARRPSRLSAAALLIVAILSVLSPAVVCQPVGAGEPKWVNPYFAVQVLGGKDKGLEMHIIAGPPLPPAGFPRTAVELPAPDIEAGINVLANVPAFTWCFGCSATSAAMIAGYYDRTGYPNMYTGPTNGGVMTLDNSSWGTWLDSCGASRAQCPLSATRSGLDGRAARGHVDDYWICYGDTGPDPYIANGWTEHKTDECTTDYMGTNRAAYGLSDGATRFYYYTSGVPYSGTAVDDGGYGLERFYESRGYTVTARYNQYIYGWNGNTQGFTYDQYKAEIDAGRPVMIHVQGHTMVGLGYDDSTSNLMYIHNTWDYSTYTMEWGGDYSGMTHYGVTIVTLGGSTSGPEIDVQRPAGTSIPDEWTDDLGVGTPGVPMTTVYTVENHGDGTLSVTGATASNLVNCSGFTVNTALPFTVPPGGTATLSVSITPSATGFSYDLAIANDDPNEAPYNIAAFGGSPPTIDVSPASLSTVVAPGGTASLSLLIGNVGDQDLDWSVGLQDVSSSVAADEPMGTGGPDTYGYLWEDSDESGGPAYSWVDITGTGTALGLGDDDYSSAIPLPFDFNFYGAYKTSVYVGSNGFLSFGAGSSDLTNDPIPTAGTPNDIVCPFWDDLDPSSAGEIYYLSNPSQFVVSWVVVPRFLDTGGNTFQVILCPDGTILNQYQSMGASTLTSATVGIENSDGSDGLQVVYNETYVKNNLAVRITPPGTWLSISPTSGTTGGGSSTPVSVDLDASGLAAGAVCTCDIVIDSNDPATPQVTVELTMNVAAGPPDTAAGFRVTSDGTVLADSTVHAASFATGSADVAEWVNVSEPVEPGDVLELDPLNPGQYRKARGGCSADVAGVVSTAPGVVLGSPVTDHPSLITGLPSPITPDSSLITDSPKALLAMIGIVPVKACDEGGPIRPGDLLVTASRSGYVRRCEPEECAFIVGKAIEPLIESDGLILVLLTR